jgi:hypothetical protein
MTLRLMMLVTLLSAIALVACGGDDKGKDAQDEAQAAATALATMLSGGGGSGATATATSGSGDAPTATRPAASPSAAASASATTGSGIPPAPTPTTAAPSGQAKTACQIVTKDDIAVVLGGTVEDPKQLSEGSAGEIKVTICNSASTTDILKGATVMVRAATPQLAVASYEVEKSISPNAEELSGIGEKAFFDPSTSRIHVLKRDADFTIEAGSSTDSPAKAPEALKVFAKKIIDRY